MLAQRRKRTSLVLCMSTSSSTTFHPAGAGRRRCRSLPSAEGRRWWRDKRRLCDDVEDGIRLGQGVVAGVVAERAFVAQRLARVNAAFDDEVSVG